jgi:aspartyl-tRNA(Asn)/glutamyl-tRNA(Gln) amidotransferase subunit B
VKQETRGWEDAKQKSVARRSKEEAQDYRYFPEPDIPPFETKVFDIEALRDSIPELPAQKRVRFAREYGLDERAVDALVGELAAANYFEEAVSEFREEIPDGSIATVYNYLSSDLRGLMNQSDVSFADLKVEPDHLASIAVLIDEKKITSRQAKDMLVKMFATGADPEEIMKSESIGIGDTDEVEAVVLAVIAEHHAAVADYKKGKIASLQFLIGQAMARLKGRARPDMLKEIFEKNLA